MASPLVSYPTQVKGNWRSKKGSVTLAVRMRRSTRASSHTCLSLVLLLFSRGYTTFLGIHSHYFLWPSWIIEAWMSPNWRSCQCSTISCSSETNLLPSINPASEATRYRALCNNDLSCRVPNIAIPKSHSLPASPTEPESRPISCLLELAGSSICLKWLLDYRIECQSETGIKSERSRRLNFTLTSRKVSWLWSLGSSPCCCSCQHF